MSRTTNEMSPLHVVVDPPTARGLECGMLVEAIRDIESSGRLLEMAGKLFISFHGYDRDPRPVFEIPECKAWLLHLERELPYLFYLLDPATTLPLLTYCHVPVHMQGSERVPDADRMMGFLFDCAFVSFQLASNHGADGKKAAADFLGRVGLGFIVNPALLDDFARTAAQEAAAEDRND
jgi:hypothetical protein